MPEEMVAAGFDKQILPRFKFKHRIDVAPVTSGAADMAFGDAGPRVFQITESGADYRLAILAESAEKKKMAETFLGWLQSAPGKAAIEGFRPDGAQVYSTELAAIKVEVAEEFDGDEVTGSRLALVHCGRCHVVDERNRMGGIGSTPSFRALRARENWSDLFRAFFHQPPHPSFTQVDGVTDLFEPGRAIHIAPVEITLEDLEAITAFVATLEPKDLGARVRSN